MKRISISLFVALAVLALLAVGCNSGGPAPTSTTTAPTAAAASSPAATAPAALGAPSPTATLGPGKFTDAFKKMSSASSYRLDISRTGAGIFSPLNGMQSPNATVTPAPTGSPATPDIAIKGSISGKDSDLTLSGLMASFSGSDATTGIQIITVGDKSYLHGPIPAMGATENKWYVMPTDVAQSIVPAVDPSTLFGSLLETGVDPNSFTKVSTETLDNHSCDIYAGNKDITLKAFQDLFKNSQNSSFVIDSADSRFWLCDDGYIHQTRLTIDAHVPGTAAQGSTPAAASQTGSFLLTMHVYDFGAQMNIQAPPNAVPLQVPGATSGSETPPAVGTPPAGGTPTP